MRSARRYIRAPNRRSRSKNEQLPKAKGDNVLSNVEDIAKGTAADGDRKKNKYYFDRHTPEYRLQFEKITEEMQSKCPVAWSETYNGHWVAADSKNVFELARCPAVSNHHDLTGQT